jgi:hypothetical protein
MTYATFGRTDAEQLQLAESYSTAHDKIIAAGRKRNAGIDLSCG